MVIKIECRTERGDTFKEETNIYEGFFAKYNLLPQANDTLLSDQENIHIVKRREFSPDDGGKVYIIVDTPL
jgi:hypothetical protein